ncbi:MAG: glycine oxidase ThiO [Pirellulaceae bacterium]
MTQRAIIVGGGVIGLSLAWELARRKLNVTLLERDTVGQATSWAAVGILPPANLTTATDPIDRLRGLSHQLYPQWTEQLQEQTNIDPGFRRCGGWYLAATPGERAAMIGMTQYWQEMDIQCEATDLSELARREPSMSAWANSAEKTSAWWTPDECQIRSPNLLAALQVACEQVGVKIIEHFDVADIVDQRDSVTVTGRCKNENNRNVQADWCVVCAGPWAGQIAPSLNLAESIVPIRGQVLLFKSSQQLLGGVVNVGNRYLVARDDGHTLVGSCEEEVGWQLGTTATMLDSLRQFAFDLCPELRNACEVRSWSGLRPMTFDGFPMVGRVPNSDSLFVAAGHFRSGLHLAPATAVVMSDLITGATPSIDLRPFSVGKQQSTSANAP